MPSETHRVLQTPITATRIGDPAGRFPIYSGEGAARVEGRWHRQGQDVIYASRNYSTAMLEKLAHYRGILPANQHFITLDIPAGLSYEVVSKDSLPEWCLPDSPQARAFGSTWFHDKRSCVLLVPSYVARQEHNVLINPHHPQFAAIKPSLETPVWWDQRLFPVVSLPPRKVKR